MPVADGFEAPIFGAPAVADFVLRGCARRRTFRGSDLYRLGGKRARTMLYTTSGVRETCVRVDAARRCVVRQRSSRWIKVRSTCLSPVSSKADALREHWAVAREHRGGRAGGEMWEGRRLGLNELARNARLAHAVPRVADNLEVRLRPGLRWRVATSRTPSGSVRARAARRPCAAPSTT